MRSFKFNKVAVFSLSKIKNLKAIHNGDMFNSGRLEAVFSLSKIKNLKAIHNGESAW